MTRKNHTLRGILQFFGVLTVLMSAAALAQIKVPGRVFGKAHAVSALPDASGAGHVPGRPGQKNLLGTNPMTITAPLFLPAVAYDSPGRGSSSVAVADLNGDGKPDLVVGSILGAPLAVLLGNGDGTFQPAAGVGSTAYTVAVADLNGDGKPDLVVTTLTGTVGVLLGNGDGTFGPEVPFASGGSVSTSVAIVDVNGDNKPDLVVANEEGQVFGGLVDVLLGNGDGTFQPAVTYDSGGGDAWSVAVVDVNGDSNPDLVVANVCSRNTCSSHGVITVLLGNGDGTFQAAAAYDSGGFDAFSVAVGDVNGDGKPDIAVVNVRSRNVGVLVGNGDGTFQPAVSYSSDGLGGGGSQSLALADVNGDGRLDLVVANCALSRSNCSGRTSGSVAVLPGNGDGTFQPAVSYGSGGYAAWAVATADVNGDGRPDLVVTDYCGVTTPNCTNGAVGVLLNNSAADTTPPVITLTATPKILWPPNGKMVPVTISGKITDTGSGVNASSAKFAVQDEYHRVQPHGTITLDAAGNYSFAILLQASRKANDLNGRKYILRVSARDNAGNRGTKAVTITVPHDLH